MMQLNDFINLETISYFWQGFQIGVNLALILVLGFSNFWK